MSKTTR